MLCTNLRVHIKIILQTNGRKCMESLKYELNGYVTILATWMVVIFSNPG